MRNPQGGALRTDGIFLPVWAVDAVESDAFRVMIVQDFGSLLPNSRWSLPKTLRDYNR